MDAAITASMTRSILDPHRRAWLLVLVALLALSGCSAPPSTANRTAVPRPLPATTAPDPAPASPTSAQAHDAWAQARAALPADVPIYRPAFIPSRFAAPELLEARADDELGALYTITYSAPDETLAFILNRGKGALGNFPPSPVSEPIELPGVRGELAISSETHAMGVFWRAHGRSYQIKAFSRRMTRNELLHIVNSQVPVEPDPPLATSAPTAQATAAPQLRRTEPVPPETPASVASSTVIPPRSTIPTPATPIIIQPPPRNTVALIKDRGSMRVTTATGAFSSIHWSWDTGAQLEVDWVPAAGATQSFYRYLIDPDKGVIRQDHGNGFQIQVDGARYAYLTGHPGQNSAVIIRRARDGSVQVIRELPEERRFHDNPYLAWTVDDRGHTIDRYDDGTVIVHDVVTGKELGRFVAPPDAELSLNDRWIAYMDGPTIHILPIP